MKVILFCLIVFIICILLSIFIYIKREEKWHNIDVTDATHGVIINENISFYRRPKISKWKKMTDLELFKQITSEMNELFEKKNSNYNYK